MPRGKGYGRKKSSRGAGRRKSGNRKTMRPSKTKGKKIYYVGGYQA